MSNTRHLTAINAGSGQLARPKHTWKGYRPSRSVKVRHEIEVASRRALKQIQKQLRVKGLDKFLKEDNADA